jgi:putative thiamine transport system permease protein
VAPGVALAWARPLTLAVFVLPIGAGLLGTLLPAFGYLPAAGGLQFSLKPWEELFAQPGFMSSLWLTLRTGFGATLLAVLLAFGFGAWIHHRPWGARIGALLAPVLSMPHAALAIGFAFFVAPSGWLVRWISPGVTGWELPPDISTVGHPSGWPLVACLLLKEVPYLMLMTLGALNQVQAHAQVRAARVLGYPPVLAYIKVVLPQLYIQLRLPILAVMAFSLSVVDVAIVLGPSHPPTLAVQAVRWFSAPEVSKYFPASALAVLIATIVLAVLALWLLAEKALKPWGRGWIERGARRSPLMLGTVWASAVVGVLYAATLLSMLGLLLWSFAQQWRFPEAWPSAMSVQNWSRQLTSLADPVSTTLIVAISSTLIALLLTMACLEFESLGTRRRVSAQKPSDGALNLLYLPLIVPQIAFVFGAQVLLVQLGWDGNMLAVVAAHLVFVLPYLFLSLADPWRKFDQRYTRTSLSLGVKPLTSFVAVKLPILLRPILIACAIAFAVSVGLYLPTLFAGAGRISTLTTEALTLAAGADRRVIAVWAVLQALLPLIVFWLASGLPRIVYRRRKGLQV